MTYLDNHPPQIINNTFLNGYYKILYIFITNTNNTSYGGEFEIMDPFTSATPIFPVFSSQPFGNNIFLASVFANSEEQSDYLASLDSDTRDYVMKHTDEFRSKQDIIDCIDRLHGGKRS